jgi:transcriptional regulator with XRE-family HTH domain
MEELTRFRRAHGWTQQQLAERSGVDKATINQAERGRRSPRVETLEKLAVALGVEMADFFPRAQQDLFSEAALARLESDARDHAGVAGGA